MIKALVTNTLNRWYFMNNFLHEEKKNNQLSTFAKIMIFRFFFEK